MINYFNRYVNFPAEITLNEDQKFEFQDDKYFLSPYSVKSQSVTYKSGKLMLHFFSILVTSTRTENQKESHLSFSRKKMLSLSLLKFTTFTVSTTTLKFTLPMSKESSKCPNGETLPSLSFTSWKTSGLLSRDSLAELLTVHRNTSTLKALSRESRPHSLMPLAVFTTETRLVTFRLREPTETSTRMRLSWHLCLDLHFWVNGSATGKLDTTCQSRVTWRKEKATVSICRISTPNSLWTK